VSVRLEALRAAGVDFVAAVPCSFLKRFLAAAELLPADAFLPAVREDHAVAACAGAFLGGRLPLAAMQNSGLGYCLEVLASLHLLYELPLPMLVTNRGDRSDLEEHRTLGQRVRPMLDLFEIPWREAAAGRETDDARWLTGTATGRRRPAVLLVGRGADRLARCRRAGLASSRRRPGGSGRCDLARGVLGPRPAAHLYMLVFDVTGRLVALGLALTCRERVVALDGDGNPLMGLGGLLGRRQAIGQPVPRRPRQRLLATTGGQVTVSHRSTWRRSRPEPATRGRAVAGPARTPVRRWATGSPRRARRSCCSRSSPAIPGRRRGSR
jgi:phosphonopyruvate decarboxylase